MFLRMSLLLLALFCQLACVAKEEKSSEDAPPIDLKKVSKAFGHSMGKNLLTLGFDFDADKIAEGMKDSLHGKEPPMSETECLQALSAIQEKHFKKIATANLEEAETFLERNKTQPNMVLLEEGKIQYKINTEGKGALVEEGFTPSIRYKGTFLNGQVFGEAKEAEKISLNETIPGFAKGIVGMKEGEKRTVFIHPDLGYGTSGYLAPNSLLTFELELVKANVPSEDEEVSSSNDKTSEKNEVAGQEAAIR